MTQAYGFSRGRLAGCRYDQHSSRASRVPYASASLAARDGGGTLGKTKGVICVINGAGARHGPPRFAVARTALGGRGQGPQNA